MKRSQGQKERSKVGMRGQTVEKGQEEKGARWSDGENKGRSSRREKRWQKG